MIGGRSGWARELASALLVVVGLLGIASYALGLPAAGALARSWLASPLPLVFNRVGSVDTFARRFELRAESRAGARVALAGDAHLAAQIAGPFSRRKVVLESLLFGDLVLETMRLRVLHHGFCRPGAVAEELGFDPPLDHVEVRVWDAPDGAPADPPFVLRCDG